MNTSRIRIWAAFAAGLVTLPVVAFIAGQHVGRSQVGDGISSAQSLESPPPSISIAPRDYRQLPIEEMLALPFTDFYEAMRAAPAAAREAWAAQVASMPPGPRRTAAFRAFYKLLAQFDPAAAAEQVAAMTDPDLQRFALHILVDAVPQSAVPMIAELVLRLNIRELYPRDSFTEICQKWAVLDPAALARFLDAHPSDKNRHLHDLLVSQWAALDPTAALDWLSRTEIRRASEEQESPPPQNRVASSLICGWFLYDPSAATRYLIEHAREPDFRHALADLAVCFYRANRRAEAKDYLKHLPDDATRRVVFERMSEAWTYEPPERREEGTGPRAVTEWITEFPVQYWEGTLGARLKQWAGEDLDGLLTWMTQQEAAVRDAVAGDFELPHDASLDESARRVLNLGDPNLRDRLLPALFRNVTEEAARETILQSNLSPAQKQHMLTLVQQADDGGGLQRID